jgi:hypothetical protein
MNISIRILDLPETIINKLEASSNFRLYDLFQANINLSNLNKEEEKILEKVLRNYRRKKLIQELREPREPKHYQDLDNKYRFEEMYLPLRTYNALISNGIRTFSDLINQIENIKIYSVENLGTKSVLQLMEMVINILKKEKKDQEIPLFLDHLPQDSFLVEKLSFSSGVVTSLQNLGIDTMGKLRKRYLEGQLLDLFSYKTLKVILEEFAKYYTDFPDPKFTYFKLVLIKEHFGKIEISKLEKMAKELGVDFNQESFLTRLKAQSYLVIEDNLIRLPTFKEKLKVAKFNSESKAILLDRFAGATLQVVADKFQKTRERIRQIVRDRMGKIHMFYEESFIEEYNKFNWHPQVFKKIFELDDFSYNIVKYLGYKFSFEEEAVFPEEYLQELFSTGKIEEFDIEAFKNTFPDIFDQSIEIYNTTVNKMTKRQFLEYVIEHFLPSAGLHKTKVVELANRVARENQLDYYYDKYIDIVSNTIQGLQNVRFYDYQSLKEETLLKLKRIVEEVDSVYSCTYFYHKYPELMKEANINDGYELHFLLRRYFAGSKEFEGKVEFNRQPMIAVYGKSYADVIIENWKQLTNPIQLDKFTNKLIKNYGYHSGTLVNIINLTLGDYISLKTLYNFSPKLSLETKNKIKELLTDDFYELGELIQIFKKAGIDNSDYQYFSNLWLNEMGYRTHDINYIIRQEFNSLKEIFFSKVLSTDFYTITKKDHKIRETTLILFIETLREEYLAFQIGPNKLVNAKYLERNNLPVADIKAYVHALTRIIPKDRFFTYESLLNEKYYLKDPALANLESKNLDKELMINFIRNIPGIKKTTKGNLFRISKQQSTVSDFINSVSKETGLTNQALVDYIKEHYNFIIRKY